jgi:histidinol-phosphate aminotransferase
LKHDAPLLYPEVTYSFYPVYCGLYDIDYETIPLGEDFGIDLENYLRPNGGVIFANPNAPTGRLLPLAAIAAFLERNTDSVVVVDEAYIDFGGETAIPLVERFPNLLVIQTVSKSRSLAGLRVGFAVGHLELIEALERVKNSFNSYPLDRFAIAGAVAAMADREYFEKTRKAVIQTREALTAELRGMGFTVLPSAANFVFARHPDWDAAALSARLREKGVLVRHFKGERIDQFLRITIGTDDACAVLCHALEKILEQ